MDRHDVCTTEHVLDELEDDITDAVLDLLTKSSKVPHSDDVPVWFCEGLAEGLPYYRDLLVTSPTECQRRTRQAATVTVQW